MDDIQKRIGKYYELLQPLADRFLFDLPDAPRQPGIPAAVLFLGNHSSGKSTFINHLAGAEVQRTGLAPVDDGFTVIMHGPTDEVDGPTLVTHPDYGYQDLERFGPAFSSRLRLKTRPIPFLEQVTLIDSPGMIDTANDSDRGYDFIAVVKHLARVADLVVLFFDPDKPGTTGETLTVLREALAGMDHKLLVVLNKVDRFESMRDFARAYGALCWNLSRTITGKDMPHIFSTYVPQPGAGEAALPLADFDASREEIVREIEHTPARRTRNAVNDLYELSRIVYTHVRVCSAAARQLLRVRLAYLGGSLAVLVVAGLLAWWFGQSAAEGAWQRAAWTSLAGIVAAAAGLTLGRLDLRRRRQRILGSLDDVFLEVHGLELARRPAAEEADLRAVWEQTRARTRRTLDAVGPDSCKLLFPGRRRLRKLARAIEREILALRQ